MEAVAVAPMEEVRLGKMMRAETRDKRLKRKTTVTWIHTESSRSVAQVARQYIAFTILEKKLLQQKQSDEVP
ncbi:hypothetical protein YC2023_111784 [Brassica napus]